MNRASPPQLQRLPATSTGTELIREALCEDGACIVTDLLSAPQTDQLLEDFAPHLDASVWGADDLGYRNAFYGNRTKRLHGLFAKSQTMATVLTQPLLLALARTAFVASGQAQDVRLSNTELMVIGSGQQNQAFHTDAASWPRIQSLEVEEILISANYALTDFTRNNGATRVVPGSHRWSEPREPMEAEICLAEMDRGSALLYTGNVLHSGGANHTQQPRAGLYLGYIPSTLRPLENQLVTNGQEALLPLSDQARQLLDLVPGGFTVYA